MEESNPSIATFVIINLQYILAGAQNAGMGMGIRSNKGEIGYFFLNSSKEEGILFFKGNGS